MLNQTLVNQSIIRVTRAWQRRHLIGKAPEIVNVSRTTNYANLKTVIHVLIVVRQRTIVDQMAEQMAHSGANGLRGHQPAARPERRIDEGVASQQRIITTVSLRDVGYILVSMLREARFRKVFRRKV